MGLLAYKDPANSPLGHLVSSLQNQAIADKVNDAILGKMVSRFFLLKLCVWAYAPVFGWVVE